MRLKVSLVLTVTVLIFTSLLSNVYAASTLQITVNESGQGNTVLTYTGGDFDIPYDSYQTVGDSLFKAAIVYAASQLGFSVLFSSIMIDISQSTKTMTITATITNIAQQIDATTWRINATLAKTVYTSWNQSGTTFTFTAPTKPQLPFPQTFNLQLPSNAVNIQFNLLCCMTRHFCLWM